MQIFTYNKYSQNIETKNNTHKQVLFGFLKSRIILKEEFPLSTDFFWLQHEATMECVVNNYQFLTVSRDT